MWDTKLESRADEGAAHRGPKLKIGSTVEVVAFLKDSKGANVAIRVKDTPINRTE